MKSLPIIHIVLIFLLSFLLIQFHLNAQFASLSWYTLIKQASDIVIIKVDRIEGKKYGEKAIAHVERSFKGVVQSDSVELPFVYSTWPLGGDTMQSVSESIPIYFKTGKRYTALLQKWHPSFNPHAAETKYEVINYPKGCLFEITDGKNPRLLEMEQLLNAADENDAGARIDSLLSFVHSDGREVRTDAIEALIDLKAEKAAEAFVSVLRNDTDKGVRYSAAHGLGYLHSDGIVNALVECLQKEKSENVRYIIISSLGMHHAKIAAPLLLGLYESEGYNIQNEILESLPSMGDSTEVPSLLRLFLLDHDRQHRHAMVQIIASFHTSEADSFSYDVLNTEESYWLKAAVIDGWRESGYTKGFDQLVKWASVAFDPSMLLSKSQAEIQSLEIPLIYAVGNLGTPQQVASTLKPFANCTDSGIRQMAVLALKEEMAKNISQELRKEIEEELKGFPSQ